MEGNREITIRDLIRTALRMAPDRIIVGEIRGEEAVDLLQAWNTGHDGSLGTAHANSTKDMISRVETMVLMGMELPLEAVRRQICVRGGTSGASGTGKRWKTAGCGDRRDSRICRGRGADAWAIQKGKGSA